MFDGDVIKKGDQVFDVAFGAGQVDDVLAQEGKIRVEFGGNRYYVYNTNGQGHFPQKTLFWHDPIGNYLPPKSRKRWALFEELRKAVSTVANTTRNVSED